MKMVYLAGPITGLTYDGCTDWRQYASDQLRKATSCRVVGRSPMRAKDYLKDRGILEKNYYDLPLSKPAGIVARDRNDVATCDAVLVNFLGATRVSIGTCVEYGWADAYRKPIITVIDKENLHDHDFIYQLSGYVVETLDEGIAIAVAVLDY